MNVIDAIKDAKLFRPYLEYRKGVTLRDWRNWTVALRLLYGLGAPSNPKARQLILDCTGREADTMPKEGFDTALLLTGRRSGKSRIAGVVGAFEGVMGGHEGKLAKGEIGLVAILAPTKKQAGIVKSYLRAAFDTPLLAGEVLKETALGFDLRNGIAVQVLAGDWRSVRGFTLVCAIVDEAAFFGVDEESMVRSDAELMRALKPALATVAGKLIAISSPYAKKGWCYRQHKQNFGNPAGRTLVWNCPSRTMNPMLPQSVVDEAMAEDMASAKAEYMGEFRDDIANYLPRSVVEASVVGGRLELPCLAGKSYVAFADLSGGRNDDAALAVGHKEATGKAVVDFAKWYKAPFAPGSVIADMADHLRRYKLRSVVGDNYAAEFVLQAFAGCGIRYERSEKNRSELYMELLPRLCAGDVELLDVEKLIAQIAGLERRTRSGGKDIVDHATGAKDDLANAVAGAVYEVFRKRIRVGTLKRA